MDDRVRIQLDGSVTERLRALGVAVVGVTPAPTGGDESAGSAPPALVDGASGPAATPAGPTTTDRATADQAPADPATTDPTTTDPASADIAAPAEGDAAAEPVIMVHASADVVGTLDAGGPRTDVAPDVATSDDGAAGGPDAPTGASLVDSGTGASDRDLVAEALASASGQAMFASRVGPWMEVDAPAPERTADGLAFGIAPVRHRRRVVGWRVAVAASDRFLQSDVCRAIAAELDVTVDELAAAFTALGLHADPALESVVGLAAEVLAVESSRIQSEQAVTSMGERLAESYEELNLLYATISSMSQIGRPEHFVQSICRDLLEVLPYAWTGAIFVDDDVVTERVAGRLFAIGKPDAGTPRVRHAARLLLQRATPGAPIVWGPGGEPKIAALGRDLVAQPIVRDDEVIGLLIAGDKQGMDLDPSSADVKLLGASAGHVGIFLANAQLYDELEAMLFGILESLTAAIDAKDPYTSGHSRRVGHLAEQLALAAGYDPGFAARARMAGLVHDVGKIGVPEEVLTKAGRLTEDEFALIKRHPQIGHRILRDIPGFEDILPGVLSHHERFDGGGYPHGLVGDQIPLIARILTLADSFDAMSSTRTYRSRLDRDEVLAEIERGSGTQFDPQLSRVFLALDFTSFDALMDDHRATQPSSPEGRAA